MNQIVYEKTTTGKWQMGMIITTIRDLKILDTIE